MIQKVIVAVFTLMVLFILSACGNNKEQVKTGANSSQTQLQSSDTVNIAEDEHDEKLVNEATSLFKTYITMTNEYDDSLADLYDDNANIAYKVLQNDTGDISNIALTGSEFKEMIIRAMPLAKVRGDIDTFSDIKYTVIADGTVKIEATRYNSFYKYSSPYSSILVKSENGEWFISAEMIEIHR